MTCAKPSSICSWFGYSSWGRPTLMLRVPRVSQEGRPSTRASAERMSFIWKKMWPDLAILLPERAKLLAKKTNFVANACVLNLNPNSYGNHEFLINIDNDS